MALAGIELRFLVNHISEKAEGYYVSNIYGIAKDSILFKLHHTEKDDLFMMVSTSGMWLTGVKVDQIEPNRLQKRLRSDLLRLKLTKIAQIGAERIAYFTFTGFGKEFVLVGEFFGDGNILLCNSEMKILALQHSIDVRHRKLGVGLEYVPPPENSMDVFNISESDFAGIGASDLAAAKWFGRTLGLPKKYVEGIVSTACVDPKKAGRQLAESDVAGLYGAAKKIIKDVSEGRHEPIIVRQTAEVVPLRMGADEKDCEKVESFMAGLDSVFTEGLVDRGRAVQTGGSEKKIKELENQLQEQQKAISTVMEKSKEITCVANSIYQMISGGIVSIQDGGAQETLRRNGASLQRDRGRTVIAVSGEKIHIDPQAQLQSIASVLFNEAKKQSGAVGSINIVMEKTRKRLDEFRSKSETQAAIQVSEIRKKSWYERYRWFFTTDGMLAIGGRDAASNSAVVRKHLGKNDRIFHGDIFGSPFFILKDGQTARQASMNEVANATVCFSRAWREGMYGLSAYWVMPEQVKKSAPSGQFLPKGSFTIEGQRNYIKVSLLRLAVGVIRQNDGYVLACGPPGPIKKGSVCYGVIEPHGSEMVDAAKKLRLEFLKLNEGFAKNISIDDFVRALPAGKSQIREVGLGDA